MIFEPFQLGKTELNNRFVRSATWEGLGTEEGLCSPELVDMMKELAIGGVGLIISGHLYVSPEGQASLRQLGIHSDDAIAGLRKMTEAVHEEGGFIVAQLAHAGCHSSFKLTGIETMGPSVPSERDSFSCREMTLEDIRNTVKAFAEGARRAKKAGFDGVQIHAAHGYLLSQFLSGYYNRRQDEYGGNVENRARFLLEVIKEVRKAVGENYPIMVKINSDDYLDGGFCPEEMLSVSMMLENVGIEAIEMSGGTNNEGSRYKFSRTVTLQSDEDEVYYRETAERYKKVCNVPLVLVGGIRSYGVADELVSSGTCDLIAMSRPFIREPHLVNRWGSGDTRPAACISCNACFRPARRGEGLYCVVEDCLRKKG